MSEAVLRSYLKDVEKALQLGNATEHTYRTYLQEALEKLSTGVKATNEPKRIRCGAPDFILTRGATPLGYIETKDIGVSLDAVERTDQMRRYKEGLANLVLTDYLEFRWYVSGNERLRARLAKVGAKGKLLPDTDGIRDVARLLQNFVEVKAPTIGTPKELATRMAAIAQLIREAIKSAFASEEGGGSLHTQMQGFKQVLLPDLAPAEFADMYAQTICYGLFAARCNTSQQANFTREYAAFHMPKTNPFLGKLFIQIAGPDLDERIAWAVDDLAEVLNHCDMESILRDFGRRTRQEDPVVHFYETFLSEYDPRMREARGVYYTPEPVVSYIVRSVDALLKRDFGLPDGLADATMLRESSADGKQHLQTHKVQILDPATGTGTFLHSAIDLIYDSFKDNQGMWSGYVSQHLLPRLFGFELLMAPYTVAHMKLGLQLAATGYDFRGSERLGVYLTNTLEEGFEGGKLPFAEWIVQEATAASNIKYDYPVMVVMGNPPYSGHSANKGSWITGLLHDKSGNYFEVDGKPLGERNPKWLNDDYVKFIRFAQWRIARTGYGILAFITNHGYLDNPTFRGMRQSLMHTFDDIYVLDLHGNSKKKEQAPDGSKDENVFDIQQGVAIGIFIKHQANAGSSYPASVHHAQLYGPREIYQKVGQDQHLIGGKYHWLAEHDITTTEWKRIEPDKPFYLFVPQDVDLREEYEQGWKITDAIPVHSMGIVTARDSLTIHWNEDEIWKTVRDFASLASEDARNKYKLGKDARDWKVVTAQEDLKKSGPSKSNITSLLYRPFDVRYTYYTGNSRGFICMPRTEVTNHILAGANLGLITNRQVNGDFQHVFCTNKSIDSCTVSLETGERSFLFPLYLYPQLNKSTLFDTNNPSTAPSGRRPNLSPAFIVVMEGKLGMRFVQDGKGDLSETFGPEDVFDYMYAVFHSPTYRSRYAEFLKIDFPRLPLTSDAALFHELCALGERLVKLHLMEQDGQSISMPKYPVAGNNVVEKVEYLYTQDEPEAGRVYINKTQYFEGVPPDVWEFHVGGYQVCQKWLKDRKGRRLEYDDIKHYQRIVVALAETIAVMERIDEVIEGHGGWPIE